MIASPSSAGIDRSTTGCTGCGIGLHREHYDDVLRERPPVRWFELISENFMVAGGRPRFVLNRARSHYPVALHCVPLSLPSAEPLNPPYPDPLALLSTHSAPPPVSTHISPT